MLVVASAGVTLGMYVAIVRGQGDTKGLLTVAACVAVLAAMAASNELQRRRAAPGTDGIGSWLHVALKSLACAVVLIGMPDVAFVAAYWCACDGRWYVGPEVQGPQVLNVQGVFAGTAVALGVAVLLRRAVWTSDLRRSSRLVSLSLAVSIVAVLLAFSWLVPRSASYRERAREHEALEFHYGGAAGAVYHPEHPPDRNKALYHGRMRRRFENAAWYPWRTVEPDPPPP
jgi:hypothetical protein